MDWKQLKREYIAGGTSYRKLAEKHKVSYNTLAKVAAKENWGSLKQETAEKITTKIIEIESDKQAERMKRLLTVSDMLLDAVEDAVSKFKAKELMLDKGANNLDYALRVSEHFGHTECAELIRAAKAK